MTETLKDPRPLDEMVCPACNLSHEKKDWDYMTNQFIKDDPLPIGLAASRRDLYHEREYVCPGCMHGIRLRDIIHKD